MLTSSPALYDLQRTKTRLKSRGAAVSWRIVCYRLGGGTGVGRRPHLDTEPEISIQPAEALADARLPAAAIALN